MIVPDAITRTFAPTGSLRASINLGNPLLARRHPETGELFGVSIDLARAFAKQLGLAVELIAFDTAGQSVDAVTQERADIGFFAIDPVRGAGIAFTPPYVLIEGCYLVREDSPLKDNEEVDRPGRRIVVGKGSAYDLFLTREIKEAELIRAPSSQAVVDQFVADRLDVAAGVKQQLQTDALRHPGLRLLPGRFMVIQQAMGLPKGRGTEAADVLTRFVEEMKANGFIGEALLRHKAEGASVAPAAKCI